MLACDSVAKYSSGNVSVKEMNFDEKPAIDGSAKSRADILFLFVTWLNFLSTLLDKITELVERKENR
jgi:hypothetical protein